MEKIVNPIFAAIAIAVALVCGCSSEDPSLEAGSSSYVGTLVFNNDLRLVNKAAFVRSRTLWDSGANVLMMSGPVQNNYWSYVAVTNVNLTVVGREAELVSLYESRYGSLDPQVSNNEE